MEKRWNILLAVAILGSLVFVSFLHANEAAEKAALASATAWLALVDGGKYPETWDQALQNGKTIKCVCINTSLISIRTNFRARDGDDRKTRWGP